jgi:hypothetical protein
MVTCRLSSQTTSLVRSLTWTWDPVAISCRWLRLKGKTRLCSLAQEVSFSLMLTILGRSASQLMPTKFTSESKTSKEQLSWKEIWLRHAWTWTQASTLSIVRPSLSCARLIFLLAVTILFAFDLFLVSTSTSSLIYSWETRKVFLSLTLSSPEGSGACRFGINSFPSLRCSWNATRLYLATALQRLLPLCTS